MNDVSAIDRQILRSRRLGERISITLLLCLCFAACSGGGGAVTPPTGGGPGGKDPGGGDPGGGGPGGSTSSPDPRAGTPETFNPSLGQRSSLSQYEITWTFDKDYATGRFANGDWWVVGPVTILTIDPPSRSGSRVMNGSMINPSASNGTMQGYDSSMSDTSYQSSMNVALDVSSANPLVVPANSSLVSTISIPTPGNRPQLRTAAILTVLPAIAPPGVFRPPYSGSDKSTPFHATRLDISKLHRYTPTSNVPSMIGVEREFERPWLDHIGGWQGRECHPVDNMPAYGRDMATTVGIGALALHLDVPDSMKAVLLIRYVQLGIDLNGIVDDGGNRNWAGSGGHGSGRKWPILFAGLLLGDDHMQSIGSRDVWFGEDIQTFIVAETSPGVVNYGYGGYTEAHVGMPEWGMEHATDPRRDTVDWFGNDYRLCCTANSWHGFVLAARMMGVEELWNHDALFAYQDRYRRECSVRGHPSWIQCWDAWTLTMWDEYRAGL